MQHEPGTDCFTPFGGYAGFQANIRKTIDKDGLLIMGVGPSESCPSFAYTIGLYEKYGFEILAFSLPPLAAQAILNDIADKLAKGEKLTLGVDDGRWANMPTRFYECSANAGERYVIQAEQFYGTNIPVVQLVVPDRAGKFPDDPAFDSAFMTEFQPLLYKEKT